MADTGAPWNIPYVEPTANPRVYPAADEAQALAIAAGLSAAGNAGIGSNVVQTVKTDTFTTNSTSFAAVTGLSVTITPTTDTSKILIVAQIAYGYQTASESHGLFKVTRAGTDIYIGNAVGSRPRVIFGGFSTASGVLNSDSIVFLDSPEVSTATTYQLEARAGFATGLVLINRTQSDFNSANGPRGASSITVIEVAP